MFHPVKWSFKQACCFPSSGLVYNLDVWRKKYIMDLWELTQNNLIQLFPVWPLGWSKMCIVHRLVVSVWQQWQSLWPKVQIAAENGEIGQTATLEAFSCPRRGAAHCLSHCGGKRLVVNITANWMWHLLNEHNNGFLNIYNIIENNGPKASLTSEPGLEQQFGETRPSPVGGEVVLCHAHIPHVF